ncbi:MAG: 23S rRNA (adenine(2503)-C(2))-methyltransferase RlmN [Candidatus Omnitrophota bacterium]
MYRDIKDFTLREVQKALSGMDEPSYRAGQIFSWLYRKNAAAFSDMANLPKPLIKKLDNLYSIGMLQMSERLVSRDKTEKFLFKLHDGNYIETVLIYAKGRETLCLSTQVGCKFACPFCASGGMGFTRDLSTSEIVGQITYLRLVLKHKITNYVFMGMGEPLDNYDNVSRALIIMNDKTGLDIGARRITLSTCGVVPGIERLAGLGLQVNLSVSLHAAEDRLRNELVSVNKIYPLKGLLDACEVYFKETGRVVTLEYVLIKDKNISPEDANKLAGIALRLKAKVNLIAYSKVPGLTYNPPENDEIASFVNRLRKSRVNVTLRLSKGLDIQAACGQLAGSKLK